VLDWAAALPHKPIRATRSNAARPLDRGRAAAGHAGMLGMPDACRRGPCEMVIRKGPALNGGGSRREIAPCGAFLTHSTDAVMQLSQAA